MESVSQSASAADEFYILRQGKIFGPFTEAAIREAAERGEFSPSDFVQQGGLPIWQSLERWLEREQAPLHPAVAPGWRAVLTWAAVRLRSDMLEGSVIVGGVCAAIGTLVAIFAHWPPLLWLPWFALAVLAGVIAMRNGRAVPGLLLLLAVAAVPVLFSLATRQKVVADRTDVMAAEGEAAPAAKAKGLPKFAEGEE